MSLPKTFMRSAMKLRELNNQDGWQIDEKFMDDNFLLQTETAQRLYHDHAEKMPIYGYHCHLSAEKTEKNRQYDNLGEIWMEGDHYKGHVKTIRTDTHRMMLHTGGFVELYDHSTPEKKFETVAGINFDLTDKLKSELTKKLNQ